MTKQKQVKKEKTPSAFMRGLDSFFCFSKRGTNIKTEIFAGLLMFLEVACFTMVNAYLLSSNVGYPQYYGIYFATILISAISSVLIGVLCNAPFTQATSLGLILLMVSIYGQYSGLTYANIMAIGLVSNFVYFLAMVIPPVRKFIFTGIPQSIRKALPAAMGVFVIVYVLLQMNVLTLTEMDYTGKLQSMAAAGDPITHFGITYITLNMTIDPTNWYGYMPAIMAIVAFVLMMVLKRFKLKHATIISFGVTLVVYLILFAIRGNFLDYYLYAFITPAYGSMYFYQGPEFVTRMFSKQLFLQAFTSGFDFSAYEAARSAAIEAGTAAGPSVTTLFVSTALAFLITGVSETGAAITAHSYVTGLQDENGSALYLENSTFKKAAPFVNAYSVNALSSMIGCALGAGPVVVRAESAVGGSEGGKTGLSAIVAGLLFIPCLFNLIFNGVFINGMVVYGILLYVGFHLLTSLKNCELSDVTGALPVLLMIVCAGFTMNLATAISVGIIADLVINLLLFKFKNMKPATFLLSIILLLGLIL